jgi:hypothetical protein
VGARMHAQEAESRRVQRASAAATEQLQRQQLNLEDDAALLRAFLPPHNGSLNRAVAASRSLNYASRSRNVTKGFVQGKVPRCISERDRSRWPVH